MKRGGVQRLTIPILSANFLLVGRVSLLTSVPSGYTRKHNGVFSLSASRAREAREMDSCFLSDAQERAKKMNLKNCMP
jgi:hypothetical protein